MRLLLFTGTGGSGTTTVAAAVALRAARGGVRTALWTVESAEALRDVLHEPHDEPMTSRTTSRATPRTTGCSTPGCCRCALWAGCRRSPHCSASHTPTAYWTSSGSTRCRRTLPAGSPAWTSWRY
ncbi:MAG: hypothetical protein IPG94_13850 [Kineosporiaceae bacterium]|nr:hypothetical protein [Kineosporiaceae bacterium]